MTFNSAALPLDASEASDDASSKSLAELSPREQGRVASIDLDAEQAAWLEAVGIGVGETMTVLRRAVFGGPIHVRTACGGEFALARALAERIVVAPSRNEP